MEKAIVLGFVALLLIGALAPMGGKLAGAFERLACEIKESSVCLVQE